MNPHRESRKERLHVPSSPLQDHNMSPCTILGWLDPLPVALRSCFVIYLIILPYSLRAAAESVSTLSLVRREDFVADFGDTIPILGQVSHTIFWHLIVAFRQ